jgi:hypothetical protein
MSSFRVAATAIYVNKEMSKTNNRKANVVADFHEFERITVLQEKGLSRLM